MYIKFKPTHIFNGFALLPADQVILMTKYGVVHDIVDADKAGDDVRELDGWLSPGFVNAHCHIELSHLKGKILPHMGLTAFVQQIISYREATPEVIEAAMEAAANELY
ncbi:MAG: hypothetical protein WD135_05250 [Ferruginibacter sp.]